MIELTKEEEQLILQNRTKTHTKLPKKVGYLKEDMFKLTRNINEVIVEGVYASETNKTSFIKAINDSFTLVFKRGAAFVGYTHDLYKNEYYWVDKNNKLGKLFPQFNDQWAIENLENIRELNND